MAGDGGALGRVGRVGGGAPWWVQSLGVFGFATLFSVVALFYGLRFGDELLATQREGITAISRIEVFEQEQVYQLRLLAERMDRIESRLAALETGAVAGEAPPP